MDKASILGMGAVALWSVLALLTVGAGDFPPFGLTALCFAIAAVVGLGFVLASGESLGATLRAAFHQPPLGWALGVGGLFGYHAVYFYALGHAPPAEASLIAYLWPLLMVVFAGAIEGMRRTAVLGALLGLAGAVVLLLPRVEGNSLSSGHLAALGCALIWSGYSALTRRFGAGSAQAVIGHCAMTALLALVAHWMLEPALPNPDLWGWLSVLALGAGPVGAAFYLWEYGCRRGDIQLLAVSAYAAPLLSTLWLVLAGIAEATVHLALASVLITTGAAIAARK